MPEGDDSSQAQQEDSQPAAEQTDRQSRRTGTYPDALPDASTWQASKEYTPRHQRITEMTQEDTSSKGSDSDSNRKSGDSGGKGDEASGKSET